MEEALLALRGRVPRAGGGVRSHPEGQAEEGWEKAIPTFPTDKKQATRNAGGVVMNAIADVVPELFGGAADLTASTKTIFKPGASFHVDPAGRNVFFGVREFGMCAAVNGMAVHGGLVPFGSTFFTFSDYCKPALAPGRVDADATRSSCSRTTRSGSAKTVRRTSRLST